MKRITELEKSRILEMYQSIPMKPWLFEQAATKEPVPSYTWDNSGSYEDLIKKGYKPEDLEKQGIKPPIQPGEPTPMDPWDYIGSSRDTPPGSFKDFVEGWRNFFTQNPLAIGLEVAVSFHPYGKILVTAMWGAFLIYDVQEALEGDPNYLNLLIDIFGIISPHHLFFISKIPKGVGKNLGQFIKKLGELEILAPIVDFLIKNWAESRLLRSGIIACLSEFEKWLKFLSIGWAVRVLKWLGTKFLQVMKFIDDLVVKILEKSGIKSKFVKTVATTASQVYATTKIIDGVKYGWDEAVQAWVAISPDVEVIAAEIPRIPRDFENLDEKFYWTYDDKDKLKFFSKSNADYKWSVHYNSGDFQQNYNQGRAWEKGKGGWDATTEVYFHKNAKINPSQWTNKK